MDKETGPTLLIAEDEQDLLDVLKDEFLYHRYKVVTAKNGAEALKIITEYNSNNQEIAAVLSDLRMPEMTGLELLQKTQDLNIHMPFVFLSAFGDRDVAVKALRLGAYDLLDKPFQNDLLVQTVESAIGLGVLMRKFEREFLEVCKNVSTSSEQMQHLKKLQNEIISAKNKRAKNLKVV